MGEPIYCTECGREECGHPYETDVQDYCFACGGKEPCGCQFSSQCAAHEDVFDEAAEREGGGLCIER